MKITRIGWLVLAGFLMTVFGIFQGSAHDIPFKVPKEARDKKNPLTRDAASTQAGQEIYKKVCESCHGVSGKGDGPAAKGLPHKVPDLSGAIRGQTDGEIFWKISRGGGLMPSYEKSLINTERWKVIHYLRTLESVKGGGP
ncbi:MAG: c-type cytochrome [Nitrospirae bacterium]|nr:c-type cytochrome [Nitrospirota bacterium]